MVALRRLLMGLGVVLGLGAAYWAGAVGVGNVPDANTTRSTAEPATEALHSVRAPETLPPSVPAAAVALENPTDVLTGSAPVPLEILQTSGTSEPAPEFIVPDLPQK